MSVLGEKNHHIIKIDMNLIRNIDKDRLKRHMVEALFSAGSKSGMKVIAEGVETIEEYKTLRDLGIELMQGFLFAKPEPDPV
ncbi:EAL domain-containing protein [Thermotoga petrophila]|uniref:EAL domain-containing protein n=1 Tax=Thermotoga petrophila TaxID=93929 RepID=UPI0021106297|nr:EAL domain-containing protein [Thermotoga petrophila]